MPSTQSYIAGGFVTLQIDYLQNLSREELEEYLHKVADEHYAEREDAIPKPVYE